MRVVAAFGDPSRLFAMGTAVGGKVEMESQEWLHYEREPRKVYCKEHYGHYSSTNTMSMSCCPRGHSGSSPRPP